MTRGGFAVLLPVAVRNPYTLPLRGADPGNQPDRTLHAYEMAAAAAFRHPVRRIHLNRSIKRR
jgi:hypothetical protein